MTAEQTVEYLLSRSRLFERSVIRDKDRRGDFCEMIVKNSLQPSLPITVTVTDGGCSLSVGQFEDVASSARMTPDEVLSAIDDIVNDRIIFVLAYKKDGDLGFGAPYFSRVFALTEGKDDMKEEYEKFLIRISKPISSLLRPFTALKGRFIIFNFSGSVNKTVVR